MKPIRKPRTVAAATEAAARYAELDGRIADANETRREQLAEVNAATDAVTNPLIEERDSIAAKIESWFGEAREQVLEGDRKSVELGGCEIGTRTGREMLSVGLPEKDLIAKLEGTKFGKTLLRFKTSLDRAAALRAVRGKDAEALTEFGLAVEPGVEVFTIKRVDEGGARS